MKKIIRMFSLFLAIGMIQTFSIPVVALSVKGIGNDSEYYETLAIEDGALTNVAALPIQNAIDDYFSFRQNNFSNELLMSHQDKMISESSLTSPQAESLARNISLKKFWEREDVDITSIESKASIVAAEQNPLTGDVRLNVYEWTWVYYNNGDGPNAPATDYMGFGTTHNMIASPSNFGGYVIASDIYDEADISGYTSPGYEVASVTEPKSLVDTDSPTAISAQSSLNRSGMPYVWNAIMYADQWVKHDIAATESANSSYYNPTYGPASSDCANYVSQCLKNSGFVFDPSTSSGRDPTSDNQFWHDQSGSSNETTCNEVWRRVSKMIIYWGDRYSYEAINSSKSNVFPGNPVIVAAENHVAICVGYNSAGKPIINGHTRDVFHQVLNGYAKTIKINTSNRLSTTPANATSISAFPHSASNQYLASEACKWYKFTVPSGGGKYRINSSGSSTVRGVLCQETVQGSLSGTSGVMAMVPIQEANGSNNFTITTSTLSAGTYYFMVKHVASSSTGSYGITFQKIA